MDIKNLADLSKIIALCQKKGVETIKMSADSVEIRLKELPVKHRKNSKEASIEVPEDSQALTQEDVLFWSASQTAGN